MKNINIQDLIRMWYFDTNKILFVVSILHYFEKVQIRITLGFVYETILFCTIIEWILTRITSQALTTKAKWKGRDKINEDQIDVEKKWCLWKITWETG